MTLSEYRNTLSWKGAIELGPGIIRLAEEMPASEELGLSHQLRQLMVEVPAAVAHDLLYATDTRHAAVLKLLAALELVDRVYPALDSAAVKTAAEQLAERLTGPGFAEGPAPAAPAPAETPEAEQPEAPAAPEPEPATEEAEEAAPAAEPTRVAVQPETTAPDAATPEVSNVQPDPSQQAQ